MRMAQEKEQPPDIVRRVGILSGIFLFIFSSLALALPPPTPILSFPPNGANTAGLGMTTAVTLTWSSASGATTYEVQVIHTGTGIVIFDQWVGNFTGLTLSGFPDNGDTYQWRVQAANADGSSGFSPFSLFVNGPSGPPGPLFLSFPADNANTRNLGLTTSVTFTWFRADRASNYRLVVTDEETGVRIFDQWIGNFTALTLSGFPDNGTEYSWFVEASNPLSTTSSSVFTFTNGPSAPPGPPSLVHPAEINVGGNAVIFTWNGAPRAKGYHFQLATDSGFTLLTLDQEIGNFTAINVQGLPDNGTTFFWRVWGVNPLDDGPSASTSFVNGPSAAPGSPPLLSPINGQNAGGATITFTWNAAARANNYDFQLATDGSFSQIVLDAQNIGNFTAINVQNLPDIGTSFFWRVRGKNSLGAGAYASASFINGPSAPPGVTPLLFPVNGQNAAGTGVTFSWNPAPRAGNYDFQLAVDSNFSQIVLDAPNLGNFTGISVQGLPDNGTTFFWRVRGKNNLGAGPFAFANFVNGPSAAPTAPAPLQPAEGATIGGEAVSFSWDPAARGAGYRFQLALDSAFTQMALNQDVGNVGGITVTGLPDDGRKFWWRVGAYNSINGAGSPVYAPARSFTNGPSGPPAPPALDAPAEGGEVDGTSIPFAWSGAARANNYHIQISLNSAFTQLILDVDLGNFGGVTVSGFGDDGLQYWWRVGATNSLNPTSPVYSAARTFFNGAVPPPPALSLPEENGSVGGTEILFAWQGTDRSLTYQLQVSRDIGFTDLLFNEEVGNFLAHRVAGFLNDGARYWWRVRGVNFRGFGPYSSVRSFVNTNAVPNPPTLSYPPDGGEIAGGAITFAWSAESGAGEYTLQVSKDSGFATLFFSQTVGDFTAKVVEGFLDDGTEYWWRVRASNNLGASGWSEVRRFTNGGAFTEGTVEGMIFAVDPNTALSRRPFSDEWVDVGTLRCSESSLKNVPGSCLTDRFGKYKVDATGAVSSLLLGPYVNVINEDTPGRAQFSSSTQKSWVWDFPSTDIRFDEVNVFYHINRVHDYFTQGLKYSALPAMGTFAATVHHGINQPNAFYLPHVRGFYFGDGDGANVRDTAKASDVIYHEFTHAVVQSIYDPWPNRESPQSTQGGAMSEGLSDYFAAAFTGDPVIGEWALPSGLRVVFNLLRFDNREVRGCNTTAPPVGHYWVLPSGEAPGECNDFGWVHHNAQVYSAALWDLRKSFPLGTIAADRLVLEHLKEGKPLNFFRSLESLLETDDNPKKGFGGNGGNPLDAPHAAQILAAFANHGMIPLNVTTATLPKGTIGAAYSVNLQGQGGTTPYQWSLLSGSLPDGLNLTAATGRISGTPTRNGSFTFTVRLTDSTPAGPETVERTGTIEIGDPTISVAPTTLGFTGLVGGANPPSRTVTISNTGGGGLTWSADSNRPWLSATPASGTAPATVNVSINLGGLSAGNYSGTLTLTAAGAVNSPQSVAVALQVDADTSPPTAPSGLAAVAVGTARIDLSWNPSTDNVGVARYEVERCQGSGCTSFSPITMATGTSYGDAGLQTGTLYRYRVRAVDAAGNFSGYSNVVSAATFDLPDLTPTALSATLSGANVIVNNTVRNKGAADAGVFSVHFYLSLDTTFQEGTDPFLCSREVAGLLAGASDPPSGTTATTCPVPAGVAPGSYRIVLFVDGGKTVAEGLENNNLMGSSAGVNLRPDLTPLSVTAAGAGTNILIQDAVQNRGALNAAAFTVSFYLSTDATFQTTDPLVCSRSVSPLSAGAAHPATGTIATPCPVPAGTAVGGYFIIAVDDSGKVIPESNEGNNVKPTATPISIGPDLIFTALAASRAGTNIVVNGQIKNQGTANAGGFRIDFYLSTDVLFQGGGDLFLCRRSIGSLEAGAQSPSTGTTAIPCPIPPGLATGPYWVIGFIDGGKNVAEGLENNNVMASSAPVNIGP